MLVNYHTHTKRCHHAGGTDREYVEAAVAAGFKALGFSDHSPVILPEEFRKNYSNYKMRPEELAGYVQSVTELREEFKSKIDIFIGVELEYSPHSFENTEKFLKDGGVEYFLLGQHFTGNEGEPPAPPTSMNHTGDKEDFTEYADTVVKSIESGKFLYIAHPDIYRYEEDDDFFRETVARICVAAKKHDVPLEVNLLGFREHRYYPAPRFWRVAGEVGAPVIIGVDAHHPGMLLDAHEKEQAVRKEYERFGLKYVERELL